MCSAVIGKRTAGAALSGVILLSAAPAARAEEPANAQAGAPASSNADASRAEALFQEGRRLFDEGKLDQACSKLAESHRTDPAVNTVGLLAACYEEQGRFTAAARGYIEVERLAGPGDERAAFARQKLAELRPKIGVITLRAGRSEGGVTIEVAGQAVAAVDMEKEMPVEPGPVVITARAPGRKEWRASIELSPGESRIVEIPPLLSDAAPPQPVAKGASPWRTVGYVAGSLGVVGLGLGAGFGIAAIGKTSASNGPDLCDEQSRCTPMGGALRDQARSYALVSTVSFGAGLALAGAGLALVLATGGDPEPPKDASGRSISPRGARVGVAPFVGPGGAGVSMAGSFAAF